MTGCSSLVPGRTRLPMQRTLGSSPVQSRQVRPGYSAAVTCGTAWVSEAAGVSIP
jgi:hypothetical protein